MLARKRVEFRGMFAVFATALSMLPRFTLGESRKLGNLLVPNIFLRPKWRFELNVCNTIVMLHSLLAIRAFSAVSPCARVLLPRHTIDNKSLSGAYPFVFRILLLFKGHH